MTHRGLEEKTRRRKSKRKTDKYRVTSELRKTGSGKYQFGKQEWEGWDKLAVNEVKKKIQG